MAGLADRDGVSEYGGSGGIIQPRSGATQRGFRDAVPGDTGAAPGSSVGGRVVPVDALNGHDELTAQEQRMVMARAARAEASGRTGSSTEVLNADGTVTVVHVPVTELEMEEELRERH